MDRTPTHARRSGHPIIPRLAPLLFTLLLAACFGPPEPPVVDEMRWLDRADPKADAANALAHDDLTLICVRGITIVCPGVDATDHAAYEGVLKQHGTRLIEGTSDAIESVEHGRLITKAWEYAERYNGYILAHPQPRR